MLRDPPVSSLSSESSMAALLERLTYPHWIRWNVCLWEDDEICSIGGCLTDKSNALLDRLCGVQEDWRHIASCTTSVSCFQMMYYSFGAHLPPAPLAATKPFCKSALGHCGIKTAALPTVYSPGASLSASDVTATDSMACAMKKESGPSQKRNRVDAERGFSIPPRHHLVSTYLIILVQSLCRQKQNTSRDLLPIFDPLLTRSLCVFKSTVASPIAWPCISSPFPLWARTSSSAHRSIGWSNSRGIMTETKKAEHITLIGAGTIGLSFAALHLTKNPTARVTIYDTRPDLEQYIDHRLSGYLLATSTDEEQNYQSRLSVATSLPIAVEYADIIQEQGPENADFKTNLWVEVEKHAPASTLFWSSTSGIPASVQGSRLPNAGKARLTVVHPYNPPHIMPLLELVPSPSTSQSTIDATMDYWRRLGRTPVLIKKECTGFVANRLAFSLFREACSLVSQGVISVEDLDAVVTSSMGPRWAVAGPFKAYHAGGGEGGLAAFMEKIGGTVQGCWDASDEDVQMEGIRVGEGEWMERVCGQAGEAYGVVDTGERDQRTRAVLEAARIRNRRNGSEASRLK